MGRGRVVDAVGGGKQLHVGQLHFLRGVAGRKSKGRIQRKDAGRSFPISFVLVRTVGRYIVEANAPRDPGAADYERNRGLQPGPG